MAVSAGQKRDVLKKKIGANVKRILEEGSDFDLEDTQGKTAEIIKEIEHTKTLTPLICAVSRLKRLSLKFFAVIIV